MIIGVTGCPGSGKSFFVKTFDKSEWEVLDADILGRQVVEDSSSMLSELSDVFGADIMNPDGSLNRKILGLRAFKDGKTVAALNGIVHPVLVERLLGEINERKERNIDTIVDCALIFEWGIEYVFDLIVCVAADDEKRTERLIERDCRRPAEIKKIFDAQLDQREKMMRSNLVIINNGNQEKLEKFGKLFSEIPDFFQEPK